MPGEDLALYLVGALLDLGELCLKQVSLSVAALWVRSRAASMSVAMSASIHLSPWKEAMVCPSCSLLPAKSTAASYAARATPTARAAIPILPVSRAFMASL